MEVLVLIAFAIACGVKDTGKGYAAGVKGWAGKQRGRWADHKKAVRERRTEGGHVRIRDLPQRAGFTGLELLGWILGTPFRGFRSGWKRRRDALAEWRKRHSIGDEEPATADDGPTPPASGAGQPQPAPAATRPDGRADLRPVPESGTMPGPTGLCRRCGKHTGDNDRHGWIHPSCAVCDRCGQPCSTLTEGYYRHPHCQPARKPAPINGGPMPDVQNLEQLKATQKAVADAARVNFEDKEADLARAKADLNNAISVAEQVSAVWPQSTAEPYKQQIEDAQSALNAATAALAAAERRLANSARADREVSKQVSADEAARAAGWKGGVTQGAPVLTG